MADLWSQDRLRSGEFTLTKVKGEENPADALTKYIDRGTLERHLKRMGLTYAEGRAASAPTLTHAIINLDDEETWDSLHVLKARRRRRR